MEDTGVCFINTEIDNCFEVVPGIYKDQRGEYVCTWNFEDYFTQFGIDFVEDDISVSHKNVFRGLHGDHETWKLVQCLYGEIILAVVDCRRPKYEYQLFNLDDVHRTQILIPPGCANGHYVLSDKAIFSYKQSEYYSGAKNQFSLRYDDPAIGIKWPIEGMNPILSERDKR